MSGRLKNKVALITGGAQGFGKGIASKFLAEGASVIITDINKTNGEKTASELGVTFFEHDVGDHKRWEEVVTAVKDQIGKLNILVNNAGIGHMGNVEQTSIEDWDMVHKVDLDSVFYMTRCVLEGMREKSFGRIISISSINGQKGEMGLINYSAAKAGLLGFTKALAQETARKNITVNAIAPGYIDTEILADASEDFMKSLIGKIPVGRLGTVDEVSRIVTFLASDEAGFITGSTISANGGQYFT